MRTYNRIVIGVTVLAGLFTLGGGLWAFLSPVSFYEQVATFPPYNRHFLHDAGAFQIGLGAALLLALSWHDALLVALAGGGAGATVHTISHVLDHDLGGRRADPFGLGILAALMLLAALLRWIGLRNAVPSATATTAAVPHDSISGRHGSPMP